MKLPIQFNVLKKPSQQQPISTVLTDSTDLNEKVTQNILNKNTSNQSSGARHSSFFGLNVDILLGGIAIGCILGVCVFWFQGVQPSLLTGFTNKAVEQADKLAIRNTDQVNSVIQVYNTISQHTAYNSLALCNQDQLYTQKTSDLALIDSKETALLPANSLSKISAFNGFYINSVKTSYQPIYTSYTEKNQAYKKNIVESRAYPFYLEYRNQWIETCAAINQSQGNTDQIKQSCTTLRTKTEEYKNNTNIIKPSIWEQSLPLVDKGLAVCAVAEQSNSSSLPGFGRWQLDWVSAYDLLMSVQPDFTSESEKFKTDAANFSASVQAFRESTLSTYNSKKGVNAWYFMNFEW